MLKNITWSVMGKLIAQNECIYVKEIKRKRISNRNKSGQE